MSFGPGNRWSGEFPLVNIKNYKQGGALHSAAGALLKAKKKNLEDSTGGRGFLVRVSLLRVNPTGGRGVLQRVSLVSVTLENITDQNVHAKPQKLLARLCGTADVTSPLKHGAKTNTEAETKVQESEDAS